MHVTNTRARRVSMSGRGWVPRAVGYSQGPQGGQLAEGVSSDFPDAVVLEATGAAREAG